MPPALVSGKGGARGAAAASRGGASRRLDVRTPSMHSLKSSFTHSLVDRSCSLGRLSRSLGRHHRHSSPHQLHKEASASWVSSAASGAAPISEGGGSSEEGGEPPTEQPAMNSDGVAPRVFKRMNERDPYRLLGITRDADYEEIHGAFVYLAEEYAMHEPSREAIDVAHDKILKDRMMGRAKSGKIKVKGKGGKNVEVYDSGNRTALTPLLNRMERKGDVKPQTIRRNALVFGVLAVWSAAIARVADPTVQMAIGAGACCYFLNQKKLENAKKDPLLWCIVQSVVFLALGFVVGTVVPAMLPDSIVLPEGVTPALLSAISALASLFVGCTWFK